MDKEEQQQFRTQIRKELREEVEREVYSDHMREQARRDRNGGLLAAGAFLLFCTAFAAYTVANPIPALVFSGIAVVSLIAAFLCAIGAWAYLATP